MVALYPAGRTAASCGLDPDYLVSARGSPALDAGQLEVLLGYATERDVAAGKVLFADGDETYDLIVMPDGTADIIQGYGQPGARLVAGYGRSQFLGEIGMLTGQRQARGGRSAAQKMRRCAELPKRRGVGENRPLPVSPG